MCNYSPPNTAYNFHRTVLSDGLSRIRWSFEPGAPLRPSQSTTTYYALSLPLEASSVSHPAKGRGRVGDGSIQGTIDQLVLKDLCQRGEGESKAAMSSMVGL
jgi:hypothetical protein